MPSSKGEHIMDSILIYQAANDLVQNTGTRNIKRIARSCSLDILETPRFKDVLGFLSLHFDKPLILINSHLDSQTKQMVCGYALGHYLEHQILMDLHTLNKSLAITDKQICLYEPNAFASHLMLDSEEVYQMTKHKMDAAQISVAKRIHINLVLVKLLELHHLGYDLRHYHAQHHIFPIHLVFEELSLSPSSDLPHYLLQTIRITRAACDNQLFIRLDILEGLNQISNTLFWHQTTEK